jgi:hypothetical protein
MKIEMAKWIFAAAVAVSPVLCFAGPRPAVEGAFQKLQTLAGRWAGTDEQGNVMKTSFQNVVSNTAVMETLTEPSGMQMLTLYSVDRNSILLVHYCPTNNQPRMRAIPEPGPIHALTFSFQGAANLPNQLTGHGYRLVLVFNDRDHITERWTWRSAGKDTEMIYRFTRVR